MLPRPMLGGAFAKDDHSLADVIAGPAANRATTINPAMRAARMVRQPFVFGSTFILLSLPSLAPVAALATLGYQEREP